MKKTKRIICKQYTDWVKSLPSCLSMMPADHPHHIINVLPSGMGSKCHDFFTIPLVQNEHHLLHHKGARQWEKDNKVNQAEEVLKTLNKALDKGLIEIKWIGKK